ncbi:MAG: hypothetical protein J07HQX50_01578 [Haloquadratum sp. J07HQX50]|nr:MAG: hypothetical protein J07HQX50_01578 [Haloquadratum sp. J07HQX50]
MNSPLPLATPTITSHTQTELKVVVSLHVSLRESSADNTVAKHHLRHIDFSYPDWCSFRVWYPVVISTKPGGSGLESNR